MALFKLLAGTHAEGKEIFKAGDVVSSDIDLADVFGSEKFQAVGNDVPNDPAPVPVVEEEPAEEEEAEEDDDESENVASSIRGLKKYIDEGLVVKETNDGFWIYDDGVQVNQEPLKKSKVKAAVVDYFG